MKELATETSKTKKVRDKLKKHFGSIDQKITTEAIEKKTDAIHSWISKHANERVVLKNTDIKLFDSNKNTAKMSPAARKLAEALSSDIKNN